jgi:ubiquitin C-terminal hydrolase
MKGILIRSYANLIKTIWAKSIDGNGVVNPYELKTQIAKYSHKFQNYAQEDAEEVFIFLLNGLSEDVNLVRRKSTPIKFDEKLWDKMSDAEKSRDQWERFLRLENSKITEMFTGQFRSTLKCTRCDYKSVTFDTFWEVNVPIPRKVIFFHSQLSFFESNSVNLTRFI